MTLLPRQSSFGGALQGGALALLALSAGCVIVEDEKSPDPQGADSLDTESTWGNAEVEAEDSGSGGSQVALISVTVRWGESQLELEVDDGESWLLGMAETGGSCGGDVPCWTGEDCFLGFSAESGESYGPLCHSVESGSLSLTYGGQMADLEPGTTVFAPAFEDTVTYVLLPDGGDRAGGDCFVFGDQPSYFADLGCNELSR